MDELSHVGMTNCWVCGEGAEILLDTRLRKSLKQNMGSRPDIICSDCISKAEDNDAIWLMSIRDDETPPPSDDEIWNPYRTGGLILIKKEAIKRMFTAAGVNESILESIDKNIYFYINDSHWKMFGLLNIKKEKPTDE
jgi:hypothetical protein